jgi:hypothetical protein
MTKIVSDPASYQVERHASSTLDQVRRLKWRLQWEKAQVENWQTSPRDGIQQAGATGSPVEMSEGRPSENHEAFALNYPASNKLPTLTEPGHSDQSDRQQPHLRYDSSGPKEAGSSTSYTAYASVGGEGVERPIFITSKTPPSVRATPLALNRQTQPAGVHVYQVDGKVEVALRNTGLNGKDGVTLMTELKSDLASLGLRLTRLTLNGELLWQTETTPPKGPASIDTDVDEIPIDKIY